LLSDEGRRRTYDHEAAYGRNPFASFFQQPRGGGGDLYARSPLVEKLDAAAWARLVQRSTQAWAVQFYHPSVFACVHFVAEWKRLAELLADEVDTGVGVVNCALEAALCDTLGVRTFPTLRLYVLAPREEAEEAMGEGEERRQEPEAVPTLLWAAFESMGFVGDTADSLVAWVRTGISEAATSRAMMLPDQGTFNARVLNSRDLWLVVYVARGTNWCTACPATEAAMRKLSGEPGWRMAHALANVSFGVVDCEASNDAKALCVGAKLGRPYSHGEGDFPQILAYPSGFFKAAPERLLPAHVGRVSRQEIADRVGQIAFPLRAALGLVAAWAREPHLAGMGSHTYAEATWLRLRDPATGRLYYQGSATGATQWEMPEGFDERGGDTQTFRGRPKVQPPPPMCGPHGVPTGQPMPREPAWPPHSEL